MKALVTGATGMIGGALVKKLLAEGAQVRCLVRPSSDTSVLPSKVEVSVADFDSIGEKDAVIDSQLRKALRGITHVFHIAGYLHTGSPFGANEPYEPYYRSNVLLTEHLLSASLHNKVHRFMFVSSVGVYSAENIPPVAEDDETNPPSTYGRSKLAAEHLVREYGKKGLDFTIIRPAITYALGDRHFLPGIIALSTLPAVPVSSGAKRLLDVVHADDISDLLYLAAQSAQAVGATYNSSSGAPLPLRTLAYECAEAYNVRKPRLITVPVWLNISLSVLFRSVIHRKLPQVSGLFNPVAISYIRRDIYYDMSRAERELNYRPRIDFKSGIRQIRQQEIALAKRKKK